MNKAAILQAIVARLETELELSRQAARNAAAGATDEQNKAENKYDTRGLELSYLAAGQGRKIAEAEATLEQFRTLALRDYKPGDPIDLSALITLENPAQPGDTKPLYFLAPRGGGTEARYAGRDIFVITPQSPLGQQLMGRCTGDRIAIGSNTPELRITKVC